LPRFYQNNSQIGRLNRLSRKMRIDLNRMDAMRFFHPDPAFADCVNSFKPFIHHDDASRFCHPGGKKAGHSTSPKENNSLHNISIPEITSIHSQKKPKTGSRNLQWQSALIPASGFFASGFF